MYKIYVHKVIYTVFIYMQVVTSIIVYVTTMNMKLTVDPTRIKNTIIYQPKKMVAHILPFTCGKQ